MFNKKFSVDSWWLGPAEKTANHGFDELFSVPEDYSIPSAPAHLKAELDAKRSQGLETINRKATTALLGEGKRGVEDVMERIFNMKNKEEEEFNNSFMDMPTATQPMQQASPLTLVNEPSASANIIVIEPRTFEDALEIVSHLKARKSVIANMQHLDKQAAQDLVNFVSGATFALDGTQERVGNGVFIFAAMNCRLETESEGTKAYKDLFQKTFGI